MTVTYNDATYTYDDTGLTYDGTLPQFDGATITVQAAFGEAPLTVDPSWQDVTEWVRDITIARGRRSEYTTFGVGTATITLDNRDRRFDPTYTSSPYYGDLNPMVPIRVEANYNGDTWTLFYGFAQGWPTSYSMPNVDAVARVTAVDGSRILSNTYLPEYALHYEMAQDGLLKHYPLQTFERATGTNPLWTYIKTYDYTGETYIYCKQARAREERQELPAGASSSLWLDPGGNDSETTNNATFPHARTLEYWFSSEAETLTSSQTGGASVFRLLGTNNYIIELDIKYDLPSLQWQLHDVVFLSDELSLYGSTYGIAQALTVNSGMNHVVGTLDGNNFKIYLNGSLIYTEVLSTSGIPPTTTGTAGLGIGSGVATQNVHFVFSHFAALTESLTTADVQRHYNAGIGFSELSSERLTRILDNTNWPTVWRDIDTGVQNVNAYLPDADTPNTYWQQIIAAEQGNIFVNREGYVQMLNRTTTETANIVAIFDDTGTDAPFSGLQVDANSIDTIRNNIIVRYTTGEVVSSDSTSITAYGESSETVDARLIDNAADATTLGDNILARAKDPRTRITQLNVNVRSETVTALPVVAPLDIGQDVAVVFTPTGVGDALWRAVTVQGIRHTITGNSWETQLYLSPSAVNTNGALLVLDDDTYGKLDDGNKLG